MYENDLKVFYFRYKQWTVFLFLKSELNKLGFFENSFFYTF